MANLRGDFFSPDLNVSRITDEMLPNDGPAADLVAGFWRMFGYIEYASTNWPSFPVSGFWMTMTLSAISLPILLGNALYCVWSIAAVGKARKTLSTILIVMLGVPAYPFVVVLLGALFWVSASALMLMMATLGTIGAWTCGLMLMCSSSGDFVANQRRLPEAEDDITFGELLVALVVCAVSMSTWGVVTVALTLLKSPLVLCGSIGICAYESSRMVKENAGGPCCPLVFACWAAMVVAGSVGLAIAIFLSVVAKFVAAGLWPAYVASGWLRHVAAGRRNETGTGICQPFVQGAKAGYQVLWASDLLTNACIFMRFDLLRMAAAEFEEIARGSRQEMSAEVRKIACLPPVVVGLFESWDMIETRVAQIMKVKTDVIRRAWEGLSDQMIGIGKEALAKGWLTQDYVESVHPALVVGLPARALLETLERSTGTEVVLASGLRITSGNRPRTAFADEAWQRIQDAKAALAELPADPAALELLRASLLAGGGDAAELPQGLQAALRDYEALPGPKLEACRAVERPLVALAVECSRERLFKDKLAEVIRALAAAASPAE